MGSQINSTIRKASAAWIVAGAALMVSFANIFAPVLYAAGSTPLTYLSVRSVLFAVLAWLFLKARNKIARLSSAQRRTACVSGLVYAGASGCLLGSFAHLPVSLAVLVFYIFPLLTRLAACALERRWPTLAEIGLLGLAFAGLVLALNADPEALTATGLTLAVLAAVGMAASYTINERRLADADNMTSLMYMASSGAIAAFAVAIATSSLVLPDTFYPGTLTLVVASVCFAAAFFGMFAGVKLAGAARTAMVMNLEPVFTIALSMLFLGERFGPVQMLGGLLVIAAVAASQPRARPAGRHLKN